MYQIIISSIREYLQLFIFSFIIDSCVRHVYHMSMIRTYIYYPKELDEQIVRFATTAKKSKAMVIREALEEGLVSLSGYKTGGVEALLKIAELGKRINATGPADLSTKMDEYLWSDQK